MKKYCFFISGMILFFGFVGITKNEVPTLPLEITTELLDVDKKILHLPSAQLLGYFAMICPTTTHGSCANCHDPLLSGNIVTQFPIGKSREFDRDLSKFIPGIVVDIQDVSVGTFLNSYHRPVALNDGALGTGGPNANVSRDSLIIFKKDNAKNKNGFQTQAHVGLEAHFQSSLPYDLRSVDFFNTLAQRAYGDPYVNAENTAVSLQIFENSYIAAEAPIQKYKRGEIALSDLREWEQLAYFEDNCMTCHYGASLGGMMRHDKIGVSDFEGFGRVDDKYVGQVLVRGLYNLKDTKFRFHNRERKSTYKAIQAHPIVNLDNKDLKMTDRQARKMGRFLDFNFWDKKVGSRTMDSILDYKYTE